MTRAIAYPIDQTLDKVESIIRVHRQISAADLADELGVQMLTLRRYVRALQLDDRIHKVKPFGSGSPAGGIWAPGPAPQDEDGAEPEPIRLSVKRWKCSRVRVSMVEAHFFGRAAAVEVRA